MKRLKYILPLLGLLMLPSCSIGKDFWSRMPTYSEWKDGTNTMGKPERYRNCSNGTIQWYRQYESIRFKASFMTYPLHHHCYR